MKFKLNFINKFLVNLFKKFNYNYFCKLHNKTKDVKQQINVPYFNYNNIFT